MVLADVIKRWHVFLGRESVLCTGTDEHGMKVQQAATAARSDPGSFCDKTSEVFKTLAARAGLANDHFVRTTDQHHIDAVQYAWTVLQEKGYIYSSKHEGWYSVSDETFYPQSGVHLVVDPATGRKMMASIETGKEVEWSSETNYRFRLSAFREKLLEHYRDNANFIVPHHRHKEVQKWVEAGLDDLSISRPSARLTWGVPVPADNSQTIYVWLDALLNYASKVGYPWAPGAESKSGFPPDVQIIGKDIVRFHCIYWPAFLMALGLPLPKQILSHSHWTLGREKMAKSTGNVVNPFFAMDRFGVDVMRFYLAHDGGVSQDADYGNEYISDRYRKALQNGLGGLSSRVLRGKKWSVQRAVQRGTAGTLAPALRSADDKFLALLHDAPTTVAAHMAALDVSAALKTTIGIVHRANVYMQAVEPWALVDGAPGADPDRLDAIIFHCAEAIRLAALLLQPAMPERMAHLLAMLGVRADRRSVAYARVGADDAYGVSAVPLGKGHEGALFPPLMVTDPPLARV